MENTEIKFCHVAYKKPDFSTNFFLAHLFCSINIDIRREKEIECIYVFILTLLTILHTFVNRVVTTSYKRGKETCYDTWGNARAKCSKVP